MNVRKLAARFLVPRPVLTLWFWARHRAFVSPRAEVEPSPHLKLGRGTRIGSFTKVKAADGPLTMGIRVDVGTGCFIASGAGGLVIGDHGLISPNVSIVGNNYRYDRLDVPIREQGQTSRGIVVGRNVWIGTGCRILDGAHLAAGVILTPNSVVGGNLPENAIAQGNPAQVIFTRR